MRGTRTATGGVSTVQNGDSVMERVAGGGGQEAEATRQLGSTVGRGGTWWNPPIYFIFNVPKFQSPNQHLSWAENNVEYVLRRL